MNFEGRFRFSIKFCTRFPKTNGTVLKNDLANSDAALKRTVKTANYHCTPPCSCSFTSPSQSRSLVLKPNDWKHKYHANTLVPPEVSNHKLHHLRAHTARETIVFFNPKAQNKAQYWPKSQNIMSYLVLNRTVLYLTRQKFSIMYVSYRLLIPSHPGMTDQNSPPPKGSESQINPSKTGSDTNKKTAEVNCHQLQKNTNEYHTQNSKMKSLLKSHDITKEMSPLSQLVKIATKVQCDSSIHTTW